MHLLRNNKISNAQSISPTTIQIPRTPRSHMKMRMPMPSHHQKRHGANMSENV